MINIHSESHKFCDNFYKMNTSGAIFMKLWNLVTVTLVIIRTKLYAYQSTSVSTVTFRVFVTGYNFNMEKSRILSCNEVLFQVGNKYYRNFANVQ